MTHLRRACAAALLACGAVAAFACGSDDSSASGDDAGTTGSDGAASGDGGIDATIDVNGVDANGGGGDGSRGTDASDAGASDTGADGGRAFLYGAHTSAQEVLYGYAWDSTSGRLSPIDMDPDAGGANGAPAPSNTIAVVAHPSGRFLYAVAYASGSTTYAYSVNPSTGVLTRINANAALDSGVNAFSTSIAQIAEFAAMDPNGRCLYIADGNGNLVAATIDPTTGALAIGRTVPSTGSKWLAVDPMARFIVGANGSTVSIHRLDAVTGLPLATDGGVGAGDSYTLPYGSSSTIALDPTGTYAYVPAWATKHMMGFRIDPTTLAMTALPTVSTSNAPYVALADPHAPFVYTNGTNGTGMGILATADGGLTEVPTDAASGALGYPLSIDPSGNHLYLNAYAQGDVAFVDIGAGGVLMSRGLAEDSGLAFAPARTYAWIRP